MIRYWAMLLVVCVAACTTGNPESPSVQADTVHIVWPDSPEPARIEYVKQFSNSDDLGLRKSFSRKVRDLLAGKDDRHMTRPYSVAVNKNLIAVADPGLAVVHLFDTSRRSYRLLDTAGEHHFESPIGIALSDERLFIADSALNKVFILDLRFKLIQSLEKFQRPTSLAFDPVHQYLYVSDTTAHQIWVFNQNGETLFKLGGRGDREAQFNYPSHIGFANDRLYVNDTMNFRIQVFSHDGQHLRSFGKHGTGSGYFVQPKGVAVDSDGHIYVADALANQVQIFDRNGIFLLGFGQTGNGPGEFMMPTGLTILDDLVYVADSHNQRVQVFRYLKEER